MNFFLHVLFASRFKADYLLEVDIVGLKKPDKDPLNKKKKHPQTLLLKEKIQFQISPPP